jgi:uncharacterized protein GlcG (DUF336 family)
VFGITTPLQFYQKLIQEFMTVVWTRTLRVICSLRHALALRHKARLRSSAKRRYPRTLAPAQKIVAAAQAEAERNDLAGAIAVVDDGGWPILLLRMDNAAYVASVELAPRRFFISLSARSELSKLETHANCGIDVAVLEEAEGQPAVYLVEHHAKIDIPFWRKSPIRCGRNRIIPPLLLH